MSTPLNEEDSAKVLALKVIEDVFRAIAMVVEVTEVISAVCETLNRKPKPFLNLGGNQQHSLVELAYLNGSIIPNEKALML